MVCTTTASTLHAPTCASRRFSFRHFTLNLLACGLAALAIRIPCQATISDNSNAAWQRAAELVDAGKIFEGILALDSLRRSGFDDPQFLSDYSRRVFNAFVRKPTDSGVAFLQDAKAAPVEDSVFPCGISWKVTANSNAAYPSYQFGASFTYRKPYHLVFQGLTSSSALGGLLRIPETARWSPTQAALQYEFGDRIDAADCTVCIDLNDTKSPLFDYIGKRIAGLYDSVGAGNDLARYHAISLRCFRRSCFYGKEGDFAAFVVFDRTLGDLLRSRGGKTSGRSDSSRRIRFTVAMRSGLDIQVFTEAKLLSVLRSF